MKRLQVMLAVGTSIALPAATLLLALPAFAQGTFVSLTGASGGNSSGALSQFFSNASSGGLVGFFNTLFTMALSVGAILAVLRLGYAGWLYMSSDSFGKKSDAKEVIFGAILGLLLLMGVWVILHQINPNLLNLNILQNISGSSSGSSNTSSGAQQVPANIIQISPM
jgi:hypothetical protein